MVERYTRSVRFEDSLRLCRDSVIICTVLKTGSMIDDTELAIALGECNKNVIFWLDILGLLHGLYPRLEIAFSI